MVCLVVHPLLLHSLVGHFLLLDSLVGHFESVDSPEVQFQLVDIPEVHFESEDTPEVAFQSVSIPECPEVHFHLVHNHEVHFYLVDYMNQDPRWGKYLCDKENTALKPANSNQSSQSARICYTLFSVPSMQRWPCKLEQFQVALTMSLKFILKSIWTDAGQKSNAQVKFRCLCQSNSMTLP